MASNRGSVRVEECEDEKERERDAQALQRFTRLEAMVQKRKDNFAYLKRIQQGDSFWLSSVLLRRQDLIEFVESHVSRQRVKHFFYLGLGVAKLLDVPAGAGFVRAFGQLLEEWEHLIATPTKQGMKQMMARNMSQLQPQNPVLSPSSGPIEADDLKATLHKFNNDVVYEYLSIPHLPFALDYFEVFATLCDVLSLVYNKFVSDECWNQPSVYDAITKIDMKIKHHVINLVAKELTNHCLGVTKSEINSLRISINA